MAKRDMSMVRAEYIEFTPDGHRSIMKVRVDKVARNGFHLLLIFRAASGSWTSKTLAVGNRKSMLKLVETATAKVYEADGDFKKFMRRWVKVSGALQHFGKPVPTGVEKDT